MLRTEEHCKDLRPHFSAGLTQEQLSKVFVCQNPRCNTRGRPGEPHMHHTKGCLEHATCIVDQPEEEIPLFTKLPEPLPVPSELGADRNKNSFVKGVK